MAEAFAGEMGLGLGVERGMGKEMDLVDGLPVRT